MIDRELLELAAKAAGLWIGFSETTPELGRTYVWNDDHKTSRWWNPLTDDGDALRLVVKLGLVCSAGGQIYTNDTDLMGAWADKNVMYGTDIYQQVTWSKATGDPYAATRRAIVLAAAEIGKAMP